MQDFNLKIGELGLKIKAHKVGDLLWIHFDGRTMTYMPESKKSRSSQGGQRSQINSGIITAPMPGKIIKINNKKGDMVEKGEVIIVMEAMKMEYSLEAAQSGLIKEINCKNSDQVSLGHILVEIE